MPTKYKLLEDYQGFSRGSIITVSGASRFADMNNGIGEVYVEPVKKRVPKKEIEKPEAKPKAKVEKKPEVKEVLAPSKDKQVKQSRNKGSKFTGSNK